MLTKNYEPVDVVQSRTMSPTCVMDSMGAASHELSVLCHKIEEDIINDNVDTNRIKLSHSLNGGGRRHPWIALYQQLNAKFQRLQMNETWYIISNIEILDACV
jgi:hypothetical protein